MRSTPVLLQGGEVGQQAFMVELLQLQEVQGPLVWKRPRLKSTSHRLEQLAVTSDQLINQSANQRPLDSAEVSAENCREPNEQTGNNRVETQKYANKMSQSQTAVGFVWGCLRGGV